MRPLQLGRWLRAHPGRWNVAKARTQRVSRYQEPGINERIVRTENIRSQLSVSLTGKIGTKYAIEF